MNNYQDQARLEILHHAAQQHALLEHTRQQDSRTLHQALHAILEITKHWTVGVNPRVTRIRRSI